VGQFFAACARRDRGTAEFSTSGEYTEKYSVGSNDPPSGWDIDEATNSGRSKLPRHTVSLSGFHLNAFALWQLR
jgi:hypothetical protein